MSDYLFIGGTNDGKRLSLDRPMSVMRLYENKEHPITSLDQVAEREMATEYYRLFPFRGESDVHELYAADGMTADQVIDALIANYRPKESP